jgi:hypothetical protein
MWRDLPFGLDEGCRLIQALPPGDIDACRPSGRTTPSGNAQPATVAAKGAAPRELGSVMAEILDGIETWPLSNASTRLAPHGSVQKNPRNFGQRTLAKKRFAGRGRPRVSRNVDPGYSRRNSPRRCNSGTTRSTKSSSPWGT